MQDASANEMLLVPTSGEPDDLELFDDLLLPTDLSSIDFAKPMASDAANAALQSKQSLPTCSSSVTPHRGKQPVTTKRRTRRHDIVALREEIAQLTAQLHALKGQQSPLRPLKAARQVQAFHESRWKSLAEKELERRQRSEEKNILLRETLKTCIRRDRRLRLTISRSLLDAVRFVDSSRSFIHRKCPLTVVRGWLWFGSGAQAQSRYRRVCSRDEFVTTCCQSARSCHA